MWNSAAVRDLDGKLLTSQEAFHERWQQHFASQPSGAVVELSDIAQTFHAPVCEVHEPLLDVEEVRAQAAEPCAKKNAMGEDGIPNGAVQATSWRPPSRHFLCQDARSTAGPDSAA